MELPTDFFVKPVDGHDDLFAFRYDFVPEGKAVEDGTAQVVTEQDNGDLIIEGYAAVFDGVDREGENFIDDAFQRGIKSFIGGQGTLAYHHKTNLALGKVLDLREEEGKGLWMKARVDGAIRKHPEMGTYYEQIKNGTLNALSVGGFFKRKLTEKGWRISGCDLTEISVTPVPVHPGTHFSVVAGKALVSDLRVPENVTADLPSGDVREEDYEMLQYALDTLGGIIDRVGRRTSEKASEPATEVVAA